MTDPTPNNPTPAPATVEAVDRAAGDYQTVWREAVVVLTRAVRFTYGTSAQPIDFADFLASALVAVAANVGSVDRLIAGRSGSWEAELVERLAHGTVLADDPDQLAAYRTEPVRVPLNVAQLVEEQGPTAEPPVLPFWQAADETIPWPPYDDPAIEDEINSGLRDEPEALEAALLRRYTLAYEDYADRFRRAVDQHAATLEGLTRSGVTVEVVTVTDPEGEGHATVVNPSEWDEPDPLVWELWNRARQQLGLPNP